MKRSFILVAALFLIGSLAIVAMHVGTWLTGDSHAPAPAANAAAEDSDGPPPASDREKTEAPAGPVGR